MDELYITYLDRKGAILAGGYRYIECWEHSYNHMLKNDAEFKTFVNNLPYTDPLLPSEAFSGGRTEIFTLFKEAEEDEEIQYLDFVSLYPAIQMEAQLPISHPQIIFGHEIKQGTIEGLFGLVKLKILPPKDLFIPVLGIHLQNGKFVFPLCRTCADNLQIHKCHHTEKERALMGVWVTSELELALEYGYRIMYIFEVWHWPEEHRSTDLFKDYLKHFFKYKIEGSGFPKDCITEEQKDKYVAGWVQCLNIKLDKSEIKESPAKRCLGKALVTNLWGKLSQGNHKVHTLFIDQASEYFDLILSDKESVTDINFVNDEMLEVHYTTDSDFGSIHPFSNVVIAAFITAGARKKLYEHICDLHERLYYIDTDSCIFLAPGPTVKDGLLGQLTDEILGTHGVHDSIGVWAGTGAKAYGYALKKNKKIKSCKVKGITLSHESSQHINLETMRHLLLATTDERVEVTAKHSMRRNKKTKRIYSRDITKRYRVTCDKRIRVPGSYLTLPYGHQDAPEKAQSTSAV